jgi:hypothetical protein
VLQGISASQNSNMAQLAGALSVFGSCRVPRNRFLGKRVADFEAELA